MLTLPALDGVTRGGMNYYDCGDLYQSFNPGVSTVAQFQFTLTGAAAPVVPATGTITLTQGNCCEGIHMINFEIPDPFPSNLNTWFADLLNTSPPFVSVGRATIEGGVVVWTSFAPGVEMEITASVPNTTMSIVANQSSDGAVTGFQFEPFTVGVINRAVDWNTLTAPAGLGTETVAGIVVSCLTFNRVSPGGCDCDCGGCDCISVKKRGKVRVPLEQLVSGNPANYQLYYRIARDGSYADLGALVISDTQPNGTLPYPTDRYDIIRVSSDGMFATINLR